MKMLEELCAIPTAPLAEDRVMRYVDQFVASRRPRLRLRRDRFGNRLIELPGRGRARRRRSAPRVVFVAHMDHPGLVARRMLDDRTLEADFRGGVRADYVSGARVRFFEAEREVRGTVQSCEAASESAAPARCAVRVASAVRAGSPGMFDLTPGAVRGGRFYSRVCDDLAGVAAALAMLDALHRRPPPGTVAVLLTRAEEVGLVGATAVASGRSSLARRNDLIISIECSAEQPYARQGDGVILRVGDRASIFDSVFMSFLHARAEQLAKDDSHFKFQRMLMPGGWCEGTVFAAYGYTTGAVCVALGNYHNMDRSKRKIAPEHIDVSDWENMVKLFTRIAREAHRYEPGSVAVRSRLEKRFGEYERLLG